MFCFTLRAAGTFFPYVVGMYWSGASTVGTAASLISGTVVVVLIDNVWHGMIGSYKVHQSIIPGLIVAGICFFVFSKLFPPKNPTTEMAPPDTAD
jgi:SSS family solute:Na+ symporter